jgi:hypothetical protein
MRFTALLTVRARNDARNPLAIMLVLDSSGSMNAFDMNYRVSTGSLSGGVCTRQLLDVSGNDHNANNYGVAIGPPKHGSNSAAFSGQQYLEAPEAASLHADTLTISAWIYPTNLSRCNNGGNTCVIAGKESEYLLGVYFNGRVYFAIRNTSPGFNWTDANFIVSANTWTHVAFTYDGAMCRSYKNGVQAGAFACTGTITDASSALRIGARNGSYAASSVPTGPFVGNIDEFRVYDAALGVSDVLTLATSTTEPDANDLLLRYDFEDLSLDQNMPCFYRAPVLPGTNCNGGVISNNSIPASYTDFNSIATFNLSQADKNKIPAGSNLWISMDRGTPQQYASGVCSHIVLGNDIYKPPFLRVQKPTSPVTYYNFSTAYTQYLSQSQIPVGTQTVQVWNAASDPYNAADLNIYRYIQTPFVNIAGTVAVPASTFESEAKPQAPFSTDVAVSAQIFEAGPCTSSASWHRGPIPACARSPNALARRTSGTRSLAGLSARPTPAHLRCSPAGSTGARQIRSASSTGMRGRWPVQRASAVRPSCSLFLASGRAAQQAGQPDLRRQQSGSSLLLRAQPGYLCVRHQ